MITAGAIVTPLGLLFVGLGAAMIVDSRQPGVSSGARSGYELGSYFVTGFGVLLTLGGVTALFKGSATRAKARQAALTFGRTRGGAWTTGLRVQF